MKRFILTGAPGAGKTTILDLLAKHDLAVVEEAATAVIMQCQAEGISEPWQHPDFIVDIAELQAKRIDATQNGGRTAQIHDRSPLCTYVLAQYLGHPIPTILAALLDRMEIEQLFDHRVFFVESLGFIEKTAARRISQDEAARFGALHAEIYRSKGYELVPVAADDPESRALAVRHWVTAE